MRQVPTRIRPLIRPLRTGEFHYVEQVFDGMSPSSRFLRFHMPVPRLTTRMRSALAAVSPGWRHGAVALVEDRAVGLAQWVRDEADPRTAEVSLAVADAYQGRGIGGQLIEFSAADAAAHGIELFSAWVHPENRPVRQMLARRPTRPGPGGLQERLVEVRHLLPEGVGAADREEAVVVRWPGAVRRSRAAAS